jgi:hypothetical protein
MMASIRKGHRTCLEQALASAFLPTNKFADQGGVSLNFSWLCMHRYVTLWE